MGIKEQIAALNDEVKYVSTNDQYNDPLESTFLCAATDLKALADSHTHLLTYVQSLDLRPDNHRAECLCKECIEYHYVISLIEEAKEL